MIVKSKETKKVRVVMIGPGRNVQGGISTVVNQYYNAGLEKCVDLRYISTMLDGNKARKLIVAIWAYIKYVFCIRNADIVHVHMSARNSFYRKKIFINLAYKYGKKIIIHMHGSEFDVFYEKECSIKQKLVVRQVFEKADVIIALSEEWKKKISEFCDSNKIVVLYNAVKLPEFKRKEYSDENVLFLGRLGERKGTYDLVNCIPEVLRTIPNAHFYLGGDGDVDAIKELIKERNLENAVSYIGWVTNEKKDEIFRKCSTFALPSYHEGMPMSILEAMSYGMVVVSTTVGGIPKVIKNGVNGYLIEPGSREQLKDCLIEALIGKRKADIGKAARDTIDQKHNIDKNIHMLIEIYKQCIGKDKENE